MNIFNESRNSHRDSNRCRCIRCTFLLHFRNRDSLYSIDAKIMGIIFPNMLAGNLTIQFETSGVAHQTCTKKYNKWRREMGANAQTRRSLPQYGNERMAATI